MNIWFTSDSHYWHNHIIQYDSRPFSCIEEHNEILTQNYNNCCKKGDRVFFVGDFSLCNKEKTLSIYNKLNVKFEGILRGNHCSGDDIIKSQWTKDLYAIKIEEQYIVLCHFALRTFNRQHVGGVHLHGHSHSGLGDILDAKILDVGVDSYARRAAGLLYSGRIKEEDKNKLKPENYKPFNYEEIKEIMSHKIHKSLDHHH